MGKISGTESYVMAECNNALSHDGDASCDCMNCNRCMRTIVVGNDCGCAVETKRKQCAQYVEQGICSGKIKYPDVYPLHYVTVYWIRLIQWYFTRDPGAFYLYWNALTGNNVGMVFGVILNDTDDAKQLVDVHAAYGKVSMYASLKDGEDKIFVVLYTPSQNHEYQVNVLCDMTGQEAKINIEQLYRKSVKGPETSISIGQLYRRLAPGITYNNERIFSDNITASELSVLTYNGETCYMEHCDLIGVFYMYFRDTWLEKFITSMTFYYVGMVLYMDRSCNEDMSIHALMTLVSSTASVVASPLVFLASFLTMVDIDSTAMSGVLNDSTDATEIVNRAYNIASNIFEIPCNALAEAILVQMPVTSFDFADGMDVNLFPPQARISLCSVAYEVRKYVPFLMSEAKFYSCVAHLINLRHSDLS